jgi:tRNA(Ile)-lysidine synthase
MQLLVAKICEQKKIPLMIRYLEIGDKTHESALRDLRFEAFDEILKLIPGKLLLAHHIDDSFEWSLMQKCRSGEYASQLGIPVKRGPVIRPFMSVSRAQIETCAKKENMEFGHDPTNSLMSIDRNYLRTHVTNNLFRRYPKSIKNYVLASNQLAQKLGLHILPKPIELNHENLKIKQWPQETIIYHPQNLAIKNISQELLKAEIYRLSTKERGKIAGQMINLIRAIKSHKLGPISFSGGVKVYLRPNCLRIVAKNYQLKDTHIPKGEPLQNDYQQFARLFLQKNRWCSVKTLCVKEGDLSKLPKIVKNLPLKPKAESDSSDKMHGFCLVDSYSFLYYWQKLASQKNMHIYL